MSDEQPDEITIPVVASLNVQTRSLTTQTQQAIKSMTKWVVLLVAVIVGLLVLQLLVLIQQVRSNNIPHLFTFSEQSVLNTLPGVKGPAITADATDVKVHAEKCVDRDVATDVLVRVQWVTVEPKGTVVSDWTGFDVLAPGCSSYEYVNPVPDFVAQRTEELLKSNPEFPCIKWQITGTDTPIETNVSQPARWGTEQFCVYSVLPGKEQ